MKYEIEIVPRRLRFKQPAGTSRGVYTTRDVWYIVLKSADGADRIGIGECAPLPDLSCDACDDYQQRLAFFCKSFAERGEIDYDAMRNYPSMLFGLETALQHYKAGSIALWNTPFSRGEQGIFINGLIWMGDYDTMLSRIEEKMRDGYRCIKLKIGAINFNDELDLLRHIRSTFSAKDIELRVDANGAFSPDEAMSKLEQLAHFDLHSIEQPIRAGQWHEMHHLASSAPFPIALDEELIGVNDRARKCELLDTISPQYIILKPSLHGGFAGCQEWIDEAEKRGIGWWITSAIETNIGLNAIAQWTATHDIVLPQGLGTGLLFTENVDMPLEIRNNALWFGGVKDDYFIYDSLCRLTGQDNL